MEASIVIGSDRLLLAVDVDDVLGLCALQWVPGAAVRSEMEFCVVSVQ